jgi:hypothetical protein
MNEVLVGFFGLVVGAVIGFGGDLYINQRKMKFESYKDTKNIINQLHYKLVEGHSDLQKKYVENRHKKPKENIMSLKGFHWDVMEIYKEFRIYFGDLKAYELQSAVYNYYYELAKSDVEDIKWSQYDFAYQSLLDAYGIMINDVRLGLVSVNFIKKADKKLGNSKISEYVKYSNRLKKALEEDVNNRIQSIEISDNYVPYEKAAQVVQKRIDPFLQEYNLKIKSNKD